MNELKIYLKTEVFSGGRISLFKLIKVAFFGSGSQRAVFYYRLAKYLYDNGFRILSIFIFRKLEVAYGVYISPNAKIGIGLKLPHPTGVVVGNGVLIGKNCTIYQQVTFGGARSGDAQRNMYPFVEDDVTVFAGAKLIGQIHIHSKSIIGANSVVTKDVPLAGVAVGVPAKIRDVNY